CFSLSLENLASLFKSQHVGTRDIGGVTGELDRQGGILRSKSSTETSPMSPVPRCWGWNRDARWAREREEHCQSSERLELFPVRVPRTTSHFRKSLIATSSTCDPYALKSQEE
ncbi:hypothetical protein J6590_103510, partial [Homalodisca vitripennis]